MQRRVGAARPAACRAAASASLRTLRSRSMPSCPVNPGTAFLPAPGGWKGVAAMLPVAAASVEPTVKMGGPSDARSCSDDGYGHGVAWTFRPSTNASAWCLPIGPARRRLMRRRCHWRRTSATPRRQHAPARASRAAASPPPTPSRRARRSPPARGRAAGRLPHRPRRWRTSSRRGGSPRRRRRASAPPRGGPTRPA